MSSSILALVCFATWTIVMSLVMVNHRVFYVLTGRRRINTFTPDGVAVSPFQARACRVHANCYENLPVFAALVLGAAAAGRGAITDSLAMVAFYARRAVDRAPAVDERDRGHGPRHVLDGADADHGLVGVAAARRLTTTPRA